MSFFKNPGRKRHPFQYITLGVFDVFRYRKLFVSIGLAVAVSGCTLTATRPVQEMLNADAALRAAKDLHADSLAPNLFRYASENYAKAKREYRLKNFESAKTLALKATRLAEQAEFEAYRLGGATPEVASKQIAPEGSLPDPEEAFKSQESLFEPIIKERSGGRRKSEEPTSDSQTEAEGLDYNEYLRQQEEKARQEEAEKQKEEELNRTKPSKPSGPEGPPTPTSSFNEKSTPQTGSLPQATTTLPPALGTVPRGLSDPEVTAPKPDYSRWILYEDSPPRKDAFIPTLQPTPIPSIPDAGIPVIGHDALPEKRGLDKLPVVPSEKIQGYGPGLQKLEGGE